MASTSTLLNVCTHNLHGIKNIDNKWAFLQSILLKCDFVCVQEHWLMNSQSHLFVDNLDNVSVTFTSAMSDDTYVIGRPYGGCAIIWHTNLKCKVKPISCRSNRLSCISVSLIDRDVTFVIINVYMPCDAAQNNLEFESVLSEMSALAKELKCNRVICIGDFNTDLKRLFSGHTRALLNFISIEDLCSFHTSMCYDVDFTFESAVDRARSTIDHVFV